jgi:hypothetical protein
MILMSMLPEPTEAQHRDLTEPRACYGVGSDKDKFSNVPSWYMGVSEMSEVF